MRVYNKDNDGRNSDDQNANRLARRLSREFGISIDHAIAVVVANGACKEPGCASPNAPAQPSTEPTFSISVRSGKLPAHSA
jgi:hypothetical protein